MINENRPLFDVGDEYQVESIVGEGAYGTVCSARAVGSGRRVAIKRVSAFKHPLCALRTLREIKLLRHFDHENIVPIVAVIEPAGGLAAFSEVYVVQELMDTDLGRVLHTQRLSDDHCQYFLYQLLRAVKYLHSAGVLHRDIKPSNLLVNANCDLKLCDFGLARSVGRDAPSTAMHMTEYVATRWYRAPELMLAPRAYGGAVDMWSVGCVLCEMLTGQPLLPGHDYMSQLMLTLGVLGSPTPADLASMASRRSREFLRSLPAQHRVPFTVIAAGTNPLAIDLLEQLVVFNPERRLSAADALHHPYMRAYHDPADEPTAAPVPPSLFFFDRFKDALSLEQLRALLYNEVCSQQRVPKK